MLRTQTPEDKQRQEGEKAEGAPAATVRASDLLGRMVRPRILSRKEAAGVGGEACVWTSAHNSYPLIIQTCRAPPAGQALGHADAEPSV